MVSCIAAREGPGNDAMDAIGDDRAAGGPRREMLLEGPHRPRIKKSGYWFEIIGSRSKGAFGLCARR